LLALGVGTGDEVIVPDFTMAACAFAVSYTGARPVFADVSRETYAILPSEIERLITQKTKAIMVVHVYGRLAPMREILKIARARKIPVIEDACEIHGAIFRSKADITVYSFYRNKIIHAEEGGMVTTDKKSIALRVNYLKNMAFGEKHDYFHKEVGYNYRMSDAQATLALQSLKAYPSNAKKRKSIEEWYDAYLNHPMKNRDAVWFYDIFVSPSSKELILKKIPHARNSFKPLSTFPMYGGKRGRQNASFLSKSLIILPVSPTLSKQEVKKICDIVNIHN
jgi:dTDP-4-amino-4,6-dideoxygalactose transaminase